MTVIDAQLKRDLVALEYVADEIEQTLMRLEQRDPQQAERRRAALAHIRSAIVVLRAL
jgi:hypothetical protein